MMRLRDRLQVLIVAGLVLAGAWLWWQKAPSADEEEALSVRAVLSAQLHKMVANPTLLSWAARFPSAGNQELAACLQQAGECRITSPASQIGFVMPTDLDPQGLHYSGTIKQPALFPLNDTKPCRDCAGWMTTTTFWATCPAGKPTCAKADAVHVRVLVRPHPEADMVSASASIPPWPEYEAGPERFAMRINLQQGM